MLYYDVFSQILMLIIDNARFDKCPRLHVVDFCCGQFAGAFGLVLALASHEKAEDRILSIQYDGCDESKLMIELGSRMWDTWDSDIATNPEMSRLHEWISRFELNDLRQTLTNIKLKLPETLLIDMNDIQVCRGDTKSHALSVKAQNTGDEFPTGEFEVCG